MHLVSPWTFLRYLRGATGESGFGASSTAEEVTAGLDLRGKVAIVTGAGSGLGAETVRVLALRGCHVFMPVRPSTVKLAEEVRAKILEATPTAKVEVMELDLSSLASVRSFTEAFKSKDLPLNILINNAGVMNCPFKLSEDGHELQFATNHLGHYLLTRELLPLLKATAKSSGTESRIVNVSSAAHGDSYPGGIRFETIDDEKVYLRVKAYGQSKLANILHANELTRRFEAEGITNVTANSLCPGGIKTPMQRHMREYIGFAWEIIVLCVVPFLKSIPQGAATQCYVATSPKLNGVSGLYFYDCNVGKVLVPEASSEELAKQLWEFSEKQIAP